MGRARLPTLLALVIAGEAIFGLPFHVARFFRPTLLEVLGFTNQELGQLFAVYGILAFVSYLPGGPIADRFSVRLLLTSSLVLTGAAGLYLGTFPSHRGLTFVFGFFGVTTILLFWAALIRATREWGGSSDQGKAFGFLDGGRGLFAAGLASLALIPFQLALPEDPSAATAHDRMLALRNVIWLYTASTLAAAVLVWWLVPATPPSQERRARSPFHLIAETMKQPSVWLQALIVVCAYSAYKGLDNYGLYAAQVYGMNEVRSAELSIIAAWIRPLAAICTGFIADGVRPSRAVLYCFLGLVAGYLGFVLIDAERHLLVVLWSNVVVTSASIFGLRGIYFALMEESEVPVHITGTAVGLISLVGFTPDIFVAPVAGWILDRSPGPVGHRQFFMLLTCVAALGAVAAVALARRLGSARLHLDQSG